MGLYPRIGRTYAINALTSNLLSPEMKERRIAYDLLFSEPSELFPVCDVQATNRMQLQHQDHGMFHIVVAGCC